MESKKNELMNRLTTEEIKTYLIDNNENFEDEIMTVCNWLLDELMVRMPEAEFVKFCETL